MSNKICNNCKQELTLNKFSKKSDTFDGLTSRCTSCIKLLKKSRIKTEPDKITEKLCNVCNIKKVILNFSINLSTKDGYENKCKECLSNIRSDRYQLQKMLNPKPEFIMPTNKFCKACYNNLSIDNFNLSTLTKDGHEGICKKCRSEKRKINSINANLNNLIKKEKKCTACKIIFSLDNFSKDGSRDDGRNYKCKFCVQKYHKIYSNYPESRIRSVIKSKKWKIKNPEHYKHYYQNNKKEIGFKVSQYRKTIDGIYTYLRFSSKYRKIPFSLTKEFIEKTLGSSCFYCNDKLDRPRFDRINSDLSYSEDNVVPCCSKCNYGKNTLSVDSFISHIKQIIKYQETQVLESRVPIIKFSGNSKNDYNLTPNGKYKGYQNSAKDRQIDFKLSFDEFFTFWQKNCNYCGLVIDTIGIDRVNNLQPYTLSNCVPCCTICNNLKRVGTIEEFFEHVIKIYKNFE